MCDCPLSIIRATFLAFMFHTSLTGCQLVSSCHLKPNLDDVTYRHHFPCLVLQFGRASRLIDCLDHAIHYTVDDENCNLSIIKGTADRNLNLQFGEETSVPL